MGRIRSIKPEFPENEPLGRCSREARLLYVLMTTHADDEGRLRANPRYLAHTLFPYDTDAEPHILGWLRELERERMALTYSLEGQSYVVLLQWHTEQRIDKPLPSRLPVPPRMGQQDLFTLSPDENASADDSSEIATARRRRESARV